MLDILRRNNKKILAIVGVFLMVAFVADFGARRGGPGGGGNEVLGTIGDEKLRADDLRRSVVEWELLSRTGAPMPSEVREQYRRFGVPIPSFPQASLAERLRGAGRDAIPLAQALLDGLEPLGYHLLLREARQMGAMPSATDVEQALADIGAGEDTLMAGAVRNWLTILAAFDQVALAARSSPAEAVHRVARRGSGFLGGQGAQQVAVRFAEFRGERFRGEVPAPTEDQLKAFFDKHKSTLPGQGETGAGFRIPDRVRVEWVRVPYDQVRDQVTLLEIVRHGRDNLQLYADQLEESAATQPAGTQPSATAPAATLPTSRPWADAKVKEAIRKDLAQRRAADLARAVVQLFNADWPNFRHAMRTTGKPAEGTTSLGTRYHEYQHVARIADAVSKRPDARGVKPRTGAESSLMTAEQLKAIPGLGSAVLPGAGQPTPQSPQGSDLPFAEYALAFYDPFLSEAERKRAQASSIPTLSQYQVSPLLRDRQGNLYVFRIVEAQPAHDPASLAEVADAVRKAYVDHQAFLKAKEAAEKLVAAARQKGGLQQALNEMPAATAPPLRETVPFSAEAPPASIPALKDLPPESATKFASDAFRLLHERVRTGEPHPAGVIELPKAGIAAAAQLEEARPAVLDGEFLATARETVVQIDREHQARMALGWFAAEAVKQRSGYKQAEAAPAREPSAPAGPQAPAPIPLGR